MRAVFFPLLGMLSVASAITAPLPGPDSLDDPCAGLTFAISAVDRALQIRDMPAPDPEMDRRRLAAVGALVDMDVMFRKDIERSPQFSRAGFIIAKEIIYSIEQYIAGELRSREINEMVKPLAVRVGRLLEDAEGIRRFFRAARTAVDQLELNLDDDSTYVSNFIARIERGIEETRRAMEMDKIGYPWAQITAIMDVQQQLVTTDEAGATFMAGTSQTYNEIMQESRSFKKVLSHFQLDVMYLGAVVEEAEDATETHIQYWSHTLDRLTNLEATGQDWLEDPWSAKRALAQWKVILQKYSECSYVGI